MFLFVPVTVKLLINMSLIIFILICYRYICLNLFETNIQRQLFRIYRVKYIRELCTLPLVVIFDQSLTGFQTI